MLSLSWLYQNLNQRWDVSGFRMLNLSPTLGHTAKVAPRKIQLCPHPTFAPMADAPDAAPDPPTDLAPVAVPVHRMARRQSLEKALWELQCDGPAGGLKLLLV